MIYKALDIALGFLAGCIAGGWFILEATARVIRDLPCRHCGRPISTKGGKA